MLAVSTSIHTTTPEFGQVKRQKVAEVEILLLKFSNLAGGKISPISIAWLHQPKIYYDK
jgi:hypothetical protein